MRLPAVLLATAAIIAAMVPAVAAPGAPTTVPAASTSDRLAELQHLRDRLAAASGDAEALDAALAAARGELDQIEARLAAASADLAAVRDDLATAEADRAAAAEEAREATEALDVATSDLDQARAALDARQDDLTRRVRSMWKYSGADPTALLLEGLARSADLHEATVTIRTVTGLVEDDTALVDAATASTRGEARSRARVATLQHQARRTEARAVAERDRVTDLVARQETLVAEIDDERQARTVVFEAIERDRTAVAQLLEQLRTQVAAASAALADALLAANPDARFDGPMPAWASGLPARGRTLAPAIVGAAAVAGVDERLFAALVWSESNFSAGAVSHAGAIGLAQLMPGTARGLGVDPWDPVQNLVGGARYLRIQLERFGTADLALAAYNAGPGRVEGAGRAIPRITETQVYVLRVLERYEQLLSAEQQG